MPLYQKNNFFFTITVSLISFFFIANYALAQENSNTSLLKDKYSNRELKILIVPGHDNETPGGAKFKEIKEADLNLKIATELFNLLKSYKNLKVFITRNGGGYTEEFLKYFKNSASDISSFRDESKKAMKNLLEGGVIIATTSVNHNIASEEDSIKLYGINKWINDNYIDLAIHIHLNDHPERRVDKVGKYSGFSIYIPEKQFPNYKNSVGIAQSVFNQLQKLFPVSDHPQERVGIVEDQDLIAIGANISLNAASMLIEYGYLYEPQFMNSNIQPIVLKELAYQTYLGIKKYFKPKEKVTRDTAILPYIWEKSLKKGLKNNYDVLALQVALTKEGVYPPLDFTKNQCGITGNFGECTHFGVKTFQDKHALPQTGTVGLKTIAKLNELYSYAAKQSAESFSYEWENDLYYGLTNSEAVRALQNALFIAGVYNGPLSGNFFESTRRSVITFQKKHNFTIVPDTGYVGPYTRKILNELFKILKADSE